MYLLRRKIWWAKGTKSYCCCVDGDDAWGSKGSVVGKGNSGSPSVQPPSMNHRQASRTPAKSITRTRSRLNACPLSRLLFFFSLQARVGAILLAVCIVAL